MIISRETPTSHSVLKLNDLLDRQINSLQSLKIDGITLDREFMEKFISNCKTLKTLEFEFSELNGAWDLLKAIKDHKGENPSKKWNQLIFKYIQSQHQQLVNQILANHPEI